MTESRSLGEVEVDHTQFHLDIEVADRFQAFSRELLRLILASIGVVGVLIEVLDIQESQDWIKVLVALALVVLGIGVAFSLSHRYLGPDAVACHLAFLRLKARQGECDAMKARRERDDRNTCLKWAPRVLTAASIALGIGAALLGVAFIGELFQRE